MGRRTPQRRPHSGRGTSRQRATSAATAPSRRSTTVPRRCTGSWPKKWNTSSARSFPWERRWWRRGGSCWVSLSRRRQCSDQRVVWRDEQPKGEQTRGVHICSYMFKCVWMCSTWCTTIALCCCMHLIATCAVNCFSSEMFIDYK